MSDMRRYRVLLPLEPGTERTFELCLCTDISSLVSVVHTLLSLEEFDHERITVEIVREAR